MKDRSDYEQAIEIIGRVIRAWDPYCLLAEGAPADEFDAEITKITAKVPEFHSSSDTAQAISNVFSASFGSGQRFSPVDCSEPAHQIFQESGRANLLPTA
ncbi:DUF1871 family protein [Frateuria sp. GZRR35]|uniref:DUF1871 family protein n=1 Tax=Frateuria sp. GZRR35 TaxID=3351536 RepID=UPI003EDB98B0